MPPVRAVAATLALALIASLAAISIDNASLDAQPPDEVESRIGIRLQADGEHDVALQQRADDGNWAPHIQATLAWSTDDLHGYRLPSGDDAILLRRHDDGRYEVGHRVADHDAVDFFPDVRFIPADAVVGRWYNSSTFLFLRIEPIAPGSPAAPAAATQLAPNAPAPYDNDYTLNTLRTLGEQYSPRTYATDAERRAAEFIAAEFRRLGYEASLQEFSYNADYFPIPITNADGAMIVEGISFNGSPGTSATGRLVDIPGLGRPDDFVGIDAEGAIVIVDRGLILFSEKAQNAADAGAAALVVINHQSTFLPGSMLPEAAIPVVGLSLEQGAALRQFAGQTATLAAVPDDRMASSANVVASRPDASCDVIVGASHDTPPGVEGANDNGSGVAYTLALARAWRDAPSADRLCFATFGFETLWNGGSGEYVARAFDDERISDQTVMLHLNAIGAGEEPIILLGDDPLTDVAETLADQLGLTAFSLPLEREIWGSHLSFTNAGVPILVPAVFGAARAVADDTFDNIDPVFLNQIGEYIHANLACLLAAANADITPPYGCE